MNTEKKIMLAKIRYLELIQEVINRMAGDSFMLKGWAVTLVSGIFVLTGEDVGGSLFSSRCVRLSLSGGWTLII